MTVFSKTKKYYHEKNFPYYFSRETATRGVLLEKVFREISQNSQENTCARVSFLIKLQAASKNTFFTENLWTTASISRTA